MVTRRRFVTDTVILATVPVAIGCGGDDESNPPAGCDGTGATSSTASGHTHAVCVPASDLMSPPTSGANYTTSSASGHTHTIALTAAELATLAGGGSVTVMATVVQQHSHTFTLE